jgi:hypothetical protein
MQAMREHLKRNLLLGLAAAAAIAAVILLVTSGSGQLRAPGGRLREAGALHRDQRLAAEYLGLSPSDLRQRLRTGESLGEIAGATHGKSAAGLIGVLVARHEAALAAAGRSEAIARARATVTAEVERARRLTAPLRAAAAYLGLSENALRAGLRSGRSLAELAAGRGKSRSGLIDALTAPKVKRLRAALAKREITPEEAKATLSTLHERVLIIVERHRRPPSG